MNIYNIEYGHILRAIKSPLQPDRLRQFINEPFVNLRTGEQLNKKEIFRSAYYYANADKWDKSDAHNQIAREVLTCIIAPHKEWAIMQNNK